MLTCAKSCGPVGECPPVWASRVATADTQSLRAVYDMRAMRTRTSVGAIQRVVRTGRRRSRWKITWKSMESREITELSICPS